VGQYNIDDKIVKKAGDDTELTPYQADEWMKCACDKYYFFENYVYIQGAKGKMKFIARDYQRAMLEVADTNLFTIALLGRQSGKTSTYAADVLWDIIFTPDYKVGITSYKVANVLDYLDRIKYSYENLEWWLKPAVVVYNKHSIKFDNSSSIIGQLTGGNTFRGMTIQRIISDELAFVKPDISEEFIGSLLPSLQSEGEESTTRLNIISTPKGTAGVFAGLWFGAVAETNGFAHIEIKYEQIPGRTPEFEQSMVSKIGRDKFDQEYKNKFIGSGGTLISSRVLESLATKEPVRTIDSLELFTNDFRGRKLGIACDVAEGVHEDNHCMQILDLETFEQVGEFANNAMPQTMYFKEIVKTIKFLFSMGAEDIYYTVEANGLGNGIMRLIENSQDNALSNAILISDVNADGVPGKRLGMLTTNRSKLAGCAQLKDMIEMHTLTLNSVKLITELKFFIAKGASFSAESGAKDDRVMGMVLLMGMLPQVSNYEDTVYDTINEVDEDDECWGVF
jgi:hypothetical protein